MSGGHFQYRQYEIGHIADEIEVIANENGCTELNGLGERIGYGFSDETINEFRKAVHALRMAQVYAHRIDWLLSCDDGEDSFHRRLAEDFRDLAQKALRRLS